MTILESLRSINAYPIPLLTIMGAAAYRGLDLTITATQGIEAGSEYQLTKADILLWLSLAPNISQGGQSYSLSDEQRVQFCNRALALYKEYDDESIQQSIYGYKGSRL